MSRNRDWCKVFESRTVADASYSGWRPATVAGVKYLRIRVRRRQPLYETSVTDVWWSLYKTYVHDIRDWSLAYSFMYIFWTQGLAKFFKLTFSCGDWRSILFGWNYFWMRGISITDVSLTLSIPSYDRSSVQSHAYSIVVRIFARSLGLDNNIKRIMKKKNSRQLFILESAPLWKFQCNSAHNKLP